MKTFWKSSFVIISVVVVQNFEKQVAKGNVKFANVWGFVFFFRNPFQRILNYNFIWSLSLVAFMAWQT